MTSVKHMLVHAPFAQVRSDNNNTARRVAGRFLTRPSWERPPGAE